MNAPLNNRAREVLRAVVWEYIRRGEPVGSRTLSKVAGLNLSPASLRNTMADLEEMGYLESPHTSAGRLPSSVGIRFFVDALLTVPAPSAASVNAVRDQLRGETASAVLDSALQTVSRLTHFAGFAAAPPASAAMKKVQFFKLSSDRIMMVLVTTSGEVINRVLYAPNGATEMELAAGARFLNRRFRGKSIREIRGALESQVADLQQRLAETLAAAFAEAADQSTAAARLKVAGEKHLLDLSGLPVDVARLRRLFGIFERKRHLLRLVQKCGEAGHVQIFVGEECGHEALEDCSVVLAPCAGPQGEEAGGVIGVVGPRRMEYERVIPLVNATAQAAGNAVSRLRADIGKSEAG